MRRLGPLLGLFALLALVTYLVDGPAEMNDFEVYHRAGARFRVGEPLYRAGDGHFEFKYAPIAAVPFVLFSFLPMNTAKVLWLGVIAVSLAVAIERLWRAFPTVPTWGCGVIVAVLARCFQREFANGQVNAPLLLLVVLGFERIARGDDRLGGAFLSIAGLFKPHFFAFVPYLLLLRRPKAASAALMVLSIGLLAPVVRYGSEGLLALYRSMNGRIAESTARLMPDTANASLPGVFAKLAHATPGVATAAAFVAIGGALYVPYRKVKADRASGVERVWEDLAILASALLLLSPQAWDFTAFTAAAALFVFFSERATLPKPLLGLGVLACIVLALDMKLLFGSGGTFQRIMHFSPNAWVLLCLLGIAIYVRSREPLAPGSA